MKKIFKILGILLLVVIAIFLIHTIRNYIIITDLQNKIDNYSNSTNYYTKSVATESKTKLLQVRGRTMVLGDPQMFR